MSEQSETVTEWMREHPNPPTFLDALDAIHAAGGHVWDEIDDPDAYIREMRGEK